jgi:hypothetical protein
MESKFLIVIFKNKKQYKIIKKYLKQQNAENFFKKLKEKSDNVIFDIQTENGKDVKYELAILEKKGNDFDHIYVTDELGRNVKVELDDSDYFIKKIIPYSLPEKITNIKDNKRIHVEDFLTKFLKGKEMKMISKLNNKIIIQENEKINIFSLKSIYDAERFIESLTKYLAKINKSSCLIVKDTDVAQKKYLYNILNEMGFDKKMLYRVSTTHLKDK